jgi:hypothetical protein
MRKTKFEKYVEIYQKLITEFAEIECEELEKITKSWKISLNDMESWLAMPKPPVSSSKLAIGLELGISEFPSCIENIEPSKKAQINTIFYDIVSSSAPDYWAKLIKQIDAIVERNLLITEQEFYILRNYLDELEANGKTKEYKKIDEILTAYEFKA